MNSGRHSDVLLKHLKPAVRRGLLTSGVFVQCDVTQPVVP